VERASNPGSAVFVDDTGRKSRRARRAANGVGALALGYVLLTLVTLARPPWVPELTLPGLGGPLPTPSQQPPALGPEAAVTPIPTADDETDDPPASDAEATPTTVAPEDATTVPATPPSTAPSPPSSGPPTTTSTSTTQPSRPGGGPPSSIPGNGNGPPTSKPGKN
jgi:hypothetical protein